jgi:hypothetical protein
MIRRSSQPHSFLVLALVVSGCASSTSMERTQPTAPVMMPVETVAVTMEAPPPPETEPGRFDTGKMWTFENAPLDYFQDEYGFRPTDEWLERVRLASLRLPNCTASFVSETGLVMTNHHCARESASEVSGEGEDLLTTGFYAETLAEERRVPDLYVDQMVKLEDVTALVEAAVRPMMAEDEEQQARDIRVSELADSASRALDLRCDVQPLYNGGKYSLYCYKRFDDVRLVLIPELQIGYFGGDPDNFTYPRYVVDMSFLRIYDENGSPYNPRSHYAWSMQGAKEGDAVFVVGNPGSTERLSTVAQLEYARDFREPNTARLLQSRTDILAHFMDHHPDQRPEYINQYFSWMNALKLYKGRLAALRDVDIMGRKRGFERRFKDAIQGDPNLNSQYGSLWDDIATIRQRMAELAPTRNGLRFDGGFWSRTLAIAATMVDYAYGSRAGAPDSILQMIRTNLEETTFNTDLDRHFLELQLEDAANWLGEDDPFVAKALGDSSFSDAARAIVAGATAVLDPAQRSALLDSPAAILTRTDPAITLAREILPRFVQAEIEYQQLQSQEEAKVAKLARALFEAYGTSVAPDATFTLRIADGVMQSYDYNGTKAPLFTTFYGMYDRHFSHTGSQEWALPDRWLTPPAAFDMSTPLNTVSTNDITGGNSGSPLINQEGEIVGLVFDGNIESLSGDFIYTTETSRTVSVRSEAILEALRNIYGAQRIVDELLGSR